MSDTVRLPALLLALGALSALIASCGGGGSDAASVDAAAGDAGAGAQVYAVNCAVCHGPDLRGNATGPPLLDEIYEPSHHSDEAFVLAIRRGVEPHHWDFGPMPPLGALSDEEVADVIAYVREQQRAVGIE